jgi:hypothetical protein
MVDGAYIQAFRKMMDKEKVKEELLSFWCLQWVVAWLPPCLSIVLGMEEGELASSSDRDPCFHQVLPHA